MPGAQNPFDQIAGIDTADPVAKGDFRSWAKQRSAQVIADANELRTFDLSGQLMVFLKSNGRTYKLDTTDTTTADDGTTCIHDFNGLRFKIVSTDGIDGTSIMSRVRAVATSNVAIATALENGDAIDGVTLATNDLVLLAGQTAPAENGVYTVVASGAASRTTAFNTYDSMPGCYFSVMEGTAGADKLYRCTSNKGGTLGTTALVFTEFSAGSGAEFTPEQYGAVGDGSTDDASAFTSMFSVVSSAGGGTVLLQNNYRIGSAITLPSNVRIVGDGSVTISAPASGAISGLFKFAASPDAGTISSNAALFDRELVLTSATSFTAGRIVNIIKTVGGGIFYNHVAEIVSVASNTIQITPPMPFALLTSDTYTLSARTPISNVTIENVTFDGNNNSSTTRGLLLQRGRNLVLRDLKFKNFVGAAAAYIDESIGTQLINLTATNSGSGSEAAFNIRAQTDLSAVGIRDRYSNGFGQLWFMITHSHMSQLSSNRAGVGATGRGVKFDGVLYSTVDQVEGNDSSATGIAISLGTNFNTFSNLVALRNRGGTGGNDIGLWFDGTSSDNIVNGVIAKNNQDLDIYLPSGSNRNTILNADYDTLSNTGSDNIVIGKKNAGIVLVGWADVDFNAANTDHAITITSPSKYWRIDSVFLINTGATASLTTARGGIFTATGGGGTTIVTDAALSAITSNAVNGAGNSLVMTVALSARYVDYATLYYRTSTAQGAAASGRVYIFGRPVV